MEYSTLSPFLMRPVQEGLWSLKETFDGTYIIDDLFDIIEVMDIKAENSARAEEQRRRDQARG